MADTNYQCRIAYRMEYNDFAMVMFADASSGDRVAFKVERQPMPIGSAVEVFSLPGDGMRQMLQSIVNEAAKIGIVPGDTESTLRAKDDNLKDLRGIVTALLPRGA